MAIQGRKENGNWRFMRENDGDCAFDEEDDCHHSSSSIPRTQTTLSTSVQASTIAALPPSSPAGPPPSSLTAPHAAPQATPSFQGNGIGPSPLQSLPTPTTAPNALSTAGPDISSRSAIAIKVGIALITIESVIIIAAVMYFIYRYYPRKTEKGLLGNFTGAGRRDNHLSSPPPLRADSGLNTLQLGFGATITTRYTKPAICIPSRLPGQRLQPLVSNLNGFHEVSAGSRVVEDAEDPFSNGKAQPDSDAEQVKLYPSLLTLKENSISGKEDEADRQTVDSECEVTTLRRVDLLDIGEKDMERELTVLEREMELPERRREMVMESGNGSWRDKFGHESGLNVIDGGAGVRREDDLAVGKI